MDQQYILKAIDAALAAGEKILSIYNDPNSDFQVEKKADNSPLTIADRAAHVRSFVGCWPILRSQS